MANDPVITPVSPQPAPAASVVTPTPVVQIVETPSVTANEAPAAIPVETPAVEPVVAAPPETVLGEALTKDAPKPITETPEAPKADGEQQPDPDPKEGQSEDPAPPSPPVYDKFTISDDFKLDDGLTKQFTDILGELELNTKADHTEVQKFGQKAVDFYIAETKKNVENYNKLLSEQWQRTQNDWKDSFLKDPEIGGNRWETTVNSALSFIRTHGGNADQQGEFKKLMNETGLGNHPAMIRLLANAGKAMAEGTPLAATRPASPPKSKVATMYGSNS